LYREKVDNAKLKKNIPLTEKLNGLLPEIHLIRVMRCRSNAFTYRYFFHCWERLFFLYLLIFAWKALRSIRATWTLVSSGAFNYFVPHVLCTRNNRVHQQNTHAYACAIRYMIMIVISVFNKLLIGRCN